MFFKEKKNIKPLLSCCLKTLNFNLFFFTILVIMFYFGKNLLSHANCYVITHKSIIFKKTLFLMLSQLILRKNKLFFLRAWVTLLARSTHLL